MALKWTIEDDDFDPMSEAHNSCEFNSYLRGPGSNVKSSMHTDQRRKEDGGIIKLHVANIPKGLKEEGLKNIFLEVGNVHSVYVNPTVKQEIGTKWGFVEFKNFSVASKAISAIHNAPPHHLSVKFAMTDEQKQSKKKIKEGSSMNEEVSIERMLGSSGRGRGRPPGIDGCNPRKIKSSYKQSEKYYDDELQLNGYSGGQFNAYVSDSLSDVANKSIGNIRCTLSTDGLRSISMGRGTLIGKNSSNLSLNTSKQGRQTELFDSCLSIFHDPRSIDMEQLQSDYKNRYYFNEDNDLYIYGQDETCALYPALVCSKCGQEARKMCSICSAPYCSRKCFVSNWNKHKKICQKGNRVLEQSKRELASSTSNTIGSSTAVTTTTTTVTGSPETLEKTVETTLAEEQLNKSVISNRNADIAKKTFVKDYTSNKQLSKPSVMSPPAPLPSVLTKNSAISLPRAPVPTDSFTEVFITFVNDDINYWVSSQLNLERLNELIERLNSHCISEKAEHISHPIVKNKCAAYYDGDWYRAVILQVSPKLLVRLVDYGNEEYCKVSDLRHLPNDLVKLPPLAFRIKLASGTSSKRHSLSINSTLRIKPISKEDDTSWLVQIEGEDYPKNSTEYKLLDNDSMGVIGPLDPLPRIRSPTTSEENLGFHITKHNNKSSKKYLLPEKGLPMQSSDERQLQPKAHNSCDKSFSSATVKTSTPEKDNEQNLNGASHDGLKSSPRENISLRSEFGGSNMSICSVYKKGTAPSIKKESAFSKFKKVDKKPVSLIPDDSPLPFKEFTEVLLTVAASSSEYWALKEADNKKALLMGTRLNSCANQKVTTPKLGEIYVKEYSELFCRARVISLDPLKVFYVDFGNEEFAEVSDLHPVPPECYGIAPYAFKIKLADGTSRKYYNLDPLNSPDEVTDSLWVKPAFQAPDKTLVVMVQGEDYSNLANPAQSAQMKHIIDQVGNNISNIDLIVNKVYCDDFIACTLSFKDQNIVSVEEINCELKKFKLLPVSEVKNLKLGTFVCCEGKDGTQGRGYVMAIGNNEVRVALVDLARVVIASKLVTIPKALSDIPDSAVRLKLLNSDPSSIKAGDKLKAIVKSCGDSLKVVLNDYGEGEVSTWIPRIEEAGLSAVVLKSDNRCTISSFQSPQSIYVQSLAKDDLLMLATLQQDIAAHTLDSPSLDRKPYIGEVVCCLFEEDGNYYRGQIIKKKNDKYTVAFVDYGNTSDVELSDMKILDDSLKMVPCAAIKVGLKDVKSTTFCIDTVAFLNDIVAAQKIFFLEFENDDLSQVKLTTSDGLDLNAKLVSLLDVGWKNCLEEGKDPTGGELFQSQDIKYVEWEVGSKIDIAIADKQCYNRLLGINASDGILDYMAGDFTQMVTSYCESFAPNYVYFPRKNELCLVRFDSDDLWYRALSTAVGSSSCKVFFIDFGNIGEVSQRDIRPITPEFAKVPSILKRIKVYGIPDDLDHNLGEKIMNLFCEDDNDDMKPFQGIVMEENGDGNVVINFPHVVQAAKLLGIPILK